MSQKTSHTSVVDTARALNFFSNFRRRIGDTKGWRRFNSFYWLTLPCFNPGENAKIFLELSRGHCSRVESYKYSFLKWLENLRDFTIEILAMLPFCFSKHDPIVGEFNANTDIVLQAWLCRNEFDEYLLNQSTYVWGDIHQKLKSDGKMIQHILFPLFSPTRHQIKKLVEVGAVVVLPRIPLNPLLTFTACAQAVIMTVRSFFILKRFDWALSYGASYLNPRLWRTRAYFNFLSQNPINFQNAKVAFPWEGQPEQLTFAEYLKQGGAEILGFLHTSANEDGAFMAKYCDDGLSNLFPHRLYVTSPTSYPAFLKAGWKQSELRCFNSIRMKEKPPEEYEGVFYLPFSIEDSSKYLTWARELVQKGKLQIRQIKLHPNNVSHPELLKLVNGIPIDPTAKHVVIGGFPSIALEALEAGLTVVQLLLREELFVDSDLYPTIHFTRISTGISQLNLPILFRGTLIAREAEKSIDSILG